MRSAAGAVSPAAAAPRVGRTLASSLAVPWGMAFLPNGNALVGERDSGDVHVVRRGGGRPRVGNIDVYSQLSRAGESGLLGLALHPGFARNRLVYAYLSTSNDNRIVRMRFADGKLGLAAGRAGRHPDERAPQRRRPGLRPGRPALRQHRRRRGRRAGPEPHLARRQGAAAHPGRRRARGQPVRQLHLVDGAPERRGHHLRRPRHAVGQRVRREGGRRAQPDRARRQLRLAAGRGQRRRRRVPRPARAVVADVDLLAGRRRCREQPGLARCAARASACTP